MGAFVVPHQVLYRQSSFEYVRELGQADDRCESLLPGLQVGIGGY